jgi:inner membrane protein
VDSLTQIALGAAVGEATLGRKVGRPAIWWGGICGLLPDLDLLIPMGDAVKRFTYHRSASHSLLILTLLTPLFVRIILKRHPETARYRIHWYALVFLAFITHILLDGLTVYGTQILWPSSAPPVMWSTIFIVDPAYSLPLFGGVAAAFFLSREKRTGHVIGMIGLVLSSMYLMWAMGIKAHVGHVARESLAQQDIRYNRILTVPSPFNTFLWRILVMGDTTYHEGYYSIFDDNCSVDFTGYPNGKHLLEELDGHWPVKRLQWFTHGFYAVQNRSGKIVITDLRMGTEPDYIFQFQVGQMTDDRITPVKSSRVASGLRLNKLGLLWKRIWTKPAGAGHDAAIPTSARP